MFLIYIAEDDEVNRFIIEKQIKKLKISYRMFNDGQEILDAFEETQPNMILLDLHMPILNGFEVCKLVKTKCDIPCIALSASINEDAESVLERGFDHFLKKPIDMTVLRALIDQYSNISFYT